MIQKEATVSVRKSYILLIVTCLLLGLSHAKQLNRVFESPFVDANCTKTVKIPTKVFTIMQCASLCNQRNDCVGFFHNKDEAACMFTNRQFGFVRLYLLQLTNVDFLEKEPRYLFITTKPAIFRMCTDVGECSEYLVPDVPDKQITASSEGSALTPSLDMRPRHARLNGEPYITPAFLQVVGAWWTVPGLNETPWIQVQFNSESVVNGITTQGRYYEPNLILYAYDERVTKYTISHSDDCSTFTSILDTDGQIRTFVGNTIPNSNAIHTNMLDSPIYALCVRLYPTERSAFATFHNVLAMRLDVVGCEFN